MRWKCRQKFGIIREVKKAKFEDLACNPSSFQNFTAVTATIINSTFFGKFKLKKYVKPIILPDVQISAEENFCRDTVYGSKSLYKDRKR